MDELNPYEPPNSSDAELQGIGESTRPSEKLIYAASLVVCIFNLPVPLQVAWPMTESSGRIGMSIATVTLMAGGCWICANVRKKGVHLVTGGVVVALSQILQVAQLVAAGASLVLGRALGLFAIQDDGFGGDVTSELGGFFITLSTGSLLMMLSAGSGFLLSKFILDPSHSGTKRRT